MMAWYYWNWKQQKGMFLNISAFESVIHIKLIFRCILQVWLSYKKIFMVKTFPFSLLFFSMLWSVKSMQLNYIKKEILST